MVTVRDPEWDAEDRAIIQAVVDMRADQCPGCGQPLSESLHVDGQPDPEYVAHYSVCLSCRTREWAEEEQEKRDHNKKVYKSARHWAMVRRR